MCEGVNRGEVSATRAGEQDVALWTTRISEIDEGESGGVGVGEAEGCEQVARSSVCLLRGSKDRDELNIKMHWD